MSDGLNSYSSPTLLSYISGLFSSLEPTRVYHSTVVLGAQLLAADAALLFALNPSEPTKPIGSLLSATDTPEGFIETVTATPSATGSAINQSAVAKLVQGFRVHVVSDVLDTATAATGFDRQIYLDYGFRSFVVVPILGKSELLVCLVLYYSTVKTLTKPELSAIATFAREAGIAIENARNYAAVSAAANKPSATARKKDILNINTLPADEIVQHLKQFESLANIGMLAASVSHEVNNSIDGIKNYLYLISSETAADHPHKEYLKLVNAELERTGKIIRQLLDLYKPTKAPYQEVNINELIEQTLLLLGKPLREKKYTVTLDLSPSLPAVKGSPDQLKQVLLNLCFNALQAMPNGGELKLSTRIDPNIPSRIQLSVIDTGSGIPEDKLPHIFEPFYTTKPGGTGLGLTVCKQIIQEHQGEIIVESKLHTGTTFHVYIPIWQPADKLDIPIFTDSASGADNLPILPSNAKENSRL
ncbi:MAG: ATP-binding protein [bacterium]|nr:ATP-binding protein [bacterium]